MTRAFIQNAPVEATYQAIEDALVACATTFSNPATSLIADEVGQLMVDTTAQTLRIAPTKGEPPWDLVGPLDSPNLGLVYDPEISNAGTDPGFREHIRVVGDFAMGEGEYPWLGRWDGASRWVRDGARGDGHNTIPLSASELYDTSGDAVWFNTRIRVPERGMCVAIGWIDGRYPGSLGIPCEQFHTMPAPTLLNDQNMVLVLPGAGNYYLLGRSDAGEVLVQVSRGNVSAGGFGMWYVAGGETGETVPLIPVDDPMDRRYWTGEP